jgi:hypothetical protein
MLKARVNTVPTSARQVAVGLPLLSQAPVVPDVLIEKSSEASKAAFAVSFERVPALRKKTAARMAARSPTPATPASALRSSFTLSLLSGAFEAGLCVHRPHHAPAVSSPGRRNPSLLA